MGDGGGGWQCEGGGGTPTSTCVTGRPTCSVAPSCPSTRSTGGTDVVAR